MSLTRAFVRDRLDSFAPIGGVLVLLDSVWGGMAALGLDLSRMNELAMAVSLVLGFPIYLLDLWINRRIAISILVFFLFRWIATCFAGPTPVLCSPWRGNLLLISALLLLQLSKFRGIGKPPQSAIQH